MKFRVETLDIDEPDRGWTGIYEGNDRDIASEEYEWWVKWSEANIKVMLSEKRWFGFWEPTKWSLGKMPTEKETKPMSTGAEIPQHIGDKIKARSKVGTNIFKGDWNMSTKQRGDVEKETKMTFRIYTHSGYQVFDRDEFRRIWEAGNAEFGKEAAKWLADDAANTINKVVAEKDAEIARLKAQLEHADVYWAKEAQRARGEELRLRDWLQKIQSAVDFRLDYATSALRGEKAP